MNIAVYRRLFVILHKRKDYWFAWLLEVAATFLIRIWAVIIMAQATTSVAQGDIERAKSQVLVFLVGYSIGHILSAIASLLLMRATNGQYRVESKNYYDKLVEKDMSFYRDNQTGYVVSMFRQYLDNMVLMSRFVVNDVSRTIISLTVPAIILMLVNWQIGLVASAVVVAQIIYIAWSSARVHDVRLASQLSYRKMTAEVSDVLTNIIAFRASGAGRLVRKKVYHHAVDETDAYWVRHRTITLYDLPRALVTTLGITAAFYFAVSAPLSGPEAVGLLVLTLTYMFQIMRNIMELPVLIQRHDDYVTKIYPTLEYLNETHETIRDPARPLALPDGPIGITVENVGFRYEAAQNTHTSSIFDNLSLSVAPGEQVGVVGLSGAGKTTLAGLIMRFDEIQSGAIKIGSVDIRELRQDDLHRAIAYVPQEPLLFHRTVRENIAYFMDNISDADVEQAARAAHAHEFIQKLPHGYDTLVGERGIKLSGGQKQRIAIARAVLKDAPITLFDEATSALDSESEAIIQRALPEILGKRTAMIIAHRLSTVAGLDRIIVLEHGQIIEQGTHQELLQAGGRYAKLWHKQTNEQL